MDPQTLNTLIQSGSFGVLVAALVWLAKVFIPGLIRDARADLQAERASHERVVERMALAHEAANARSIDALNALAEGFRDLSARHDRLEEQVHILTERK